MMREEARQNRTWRWWIVAGAMIGIAGGLAVPSGAQAPAPDAPLVWTKHFKLPDGRTFVTDGALMLDAALAKPDKLPPTELPAETGKIMQKQMDAPRDQEVALSSLSRGTKPRTYVASNGITFSAKYVDYLRQTLPARRVQLKMKGELTPVVIVLDGKTIGMVMAMKGS